jgi:hypothetical protein
MKIPEHMDSADLGGYIPTDDEARAWCRKESDNVHPDDLGDFIENYLDPEWISRGRDAVDTWHYYLKHDPRTLADALVEYMTDNGL